MTGLERADACVHCGTAPCSHPGVLVAPPERLPAWLVLLVLLVAVGAGLALGSYLTSWVVGG